MTQKPSSLNSYMAISHEYRYEKNLFFKTSFSLISNNGLEHRQKWKVHFVCCMCKVPFISKSLVIHIRR